MRRYALLIILSCTVMMASTSYRDTIPEAKIQMKAKELTDRKLESLSNDKYRDMLVIQFRDLRALIDSLYAESIRKQESIELASMGRDSVTQVLLMTVAENMALKASNEQYEKDINFISKTPTYLFIFILMIVAVLIGQGVYNYYKERKKPL